MYGISYENHTVHVLSDCPFLVPPDSVNTAHVLSDCPSFAPPDGVHTVPADDNNDDLTNWLGLLELHRVGET